MISLRSKVTRKILNYFYLNSTEEFYTNELARQLAVDKRNLVKKLHELEQKGILKCRSKGNLKLYSINEEYPLLEEYKKIILKTVGIENDLKEILLKTKGVNEAYLFGSYAKNNMEGHSDIDLLVVGSHSVIALQRKITGLQEQSNREINVVNMDSKDFINRMKRKDPFISGVINGKHIKVI